MNREIDEKFAYIKDSLDRIEAQTLKTNGRVTSLEGKVKEQEKRTDRISLYMKVGGWVAGGVWAIILTVLGGIVGHWKI